MIDIPMPACLIREDGSKTPLDSPYEQGFYIGSYGASQDENPYTRLDKLNFRLWVKGWAEAVRLTLASKGASE